MFNSNWTISESTIPEGIIYLPFNFSMRFLFIPFYYLHTIHVDGQVFRKSSSMAAFIQKNE